MSEAKTTGRPAGLRRLVRAFGQEFGSGYHAARLSMYEAHAKHFGVLLNRYGAAAANGYLTAGLSLAECDALHVVRQQAEMKDLAATHERRVAELLAEHEMAILHRDMAHQSETEALVAHLQAWLDANVPPKPRTLGERIRAALSALLD